MKIISASYLYNPGYPLIEGGAVAVSDGLIIETGTLDGLKRSYNWPVDDYAGSVLMPGMVNAHTHLELTHFPSWKIRKGVDYAPRQYVDWITQLVKICRALNIDELKHSIKEGAAISLASGTTSVGDILSNLELLGEYSNMPVSGRVYLEGIGHDPVKCAAREGEIISALKTFNGHNILPGISPHTPHTVSADFMMQLKVLAESRSLPMMIHLAESADEVDFCYDSTGRIADEIFKNAGWDQYIPAPRRMSPVAYLDSLGVLTPMTTCVHAVHMTPADVNLLRERSVSVVLCPRSNESLDVGKPPLILFKAGRIPVALGTDSLASNDSLSLWDEIRFLYEDSPMIYNPDELFAIATIGGAKALHIESTAGTLEPGKRGDIQVLNCTGKLSPERIASSLIETANVSAVYLAGNRIE